MAKNVFISFRYADGINYKSALSNMFDFYYDTVDFSEDNDRSQMSEETIRQYLYRKLRRSSVTIIILTPLAVTHKRNRYGEYDDWMYDEIRYSLEDRENNRTNGLIAVYTSDAAQKLVSDGDNGLTLVEDVDNLFRKNMMNVKPLYKKNRKPELYDRDFDSYCSLISWDEFIQDIGKHIEIATKKREELYKYEIIKRL